RGTKGGTECRQWFFHNINPLPPPFTFPAKTGIPSPFQPDR
ncbi:MAG: hypothetical protein RLZZ563_1545, partial [Pseudomonadota bacterium]